MQYKITWLIFLFCFLQASLIFGQSPRTDTIPSLPPKSDAKLERDTKDSTSWLSDTTFQKKKHSPRKATLYSTALPGLGQVYNRQYYKVPILAAIGVLLATQIVSNDYDLLQANRNLDTRTRNDQYTNDQKKLLPYDVFDAYDPAKPSNFVGSGNRTFTTDQLRLTRDGYRRDRDFYIILSVLTYALNIVDAAVFAHLREFKVNDKLSLKLSPDFRLVNGTASASAGMRVSFNFVHKNN